MEDKNGKVNIEDKLYLNSFHVGTESHLHIVDKDVCRECKNRTCTKICPADVYEWKENEISISFEGCLECGSCRIACSQQNIDWNHPKGGFGIQFRLA